MSASIPYHIPALLDETIIGLNIKPSGTYVDATYGGGGHTNAIIERLSASEGGRVFAFDQDTDAIARAPKDEPRLVMVHSNFRYITNFLRFHNVTAVDGILADLGVSSHHFDDATRGFSFRADGPLDMRMNRNARLTAAELLNTASPESLTSILKNYGELSQARRIADAIIRRRNQGHPFETISSLLDTISPLIDPRKEKKELAQVFQALRIYVNDELSALRALLNSAPRLLRPNGRIAIITYHSLEDRLVKNFLKTGNIEGIVNKDFYGHIQAPLRQLSSKPIIPTAQEIERNPRSRSAKLRIAEKI